MSGAAGAIGGSESTAAPRRPGRARASDPGPAVRSVTRRRPQPYVERGDASGGRFVGGTGHEPAVLPLAGPASHAPRTTSAFFPKRNAAGRYPSPLLT